MTNTRPRLTPVPGLARVPGPQAPLNVRTRTSGMMSTGDMAALEDASDTEF